MSRPGSTRSASPATADRRRRSPSDSTARRSAWCRTPTTDACPRADQRGVVGRALRPCNAGAYQDAEVIPSGQVIGWGSNGIGELGNGGTANTSVPVSSSGLAGAVAVAAGESHSCALIEDGTARCWGYNLSGQLGNGTIIDSLVPVTVSGLTGATAISAGGAHTCALIGDGTIRCWGGNDDGWIGDGTNAGRLTPVTVVGITDAVAISAGRRHTCAVLRSGGARCWGQNLGKLGDGTNTTSFVPVAVSGINNAVAIAAGTVHTCAVLADGTGRCWGSNIGGLLGNGNETDSNVPVVVSGLSGATAITAGFNHACARLVDGTVRCWGLNQEGQLGTTAVGSSSVPVPVTGLTGVVALSSSTAGNHVCAMLGNGGARCWGRNFEGQLGNGASLPAFNSTVPVTVLDDPEQVTIAIAAGAYQSLAIQTPVLTVSGSAGPLQLPAAVTGIDVGERPVRPDPAAARRCRWHADQAHRPRRDRVGGEPARRDRACRHPDQADLVVVAADDGRWRLGRAARRTRASPESRSSP